MTARGWSSAPSGRIVVRGIVVSDRQRTLGAVGGTKQVLRDGSRMSDTLWLEHGIRAPSHARRWIIERCHEWHCDDLADPAGLLITELVTNVFLHARTDCVIQAAFDHPVLAITVTDGDDQGLSLVSPSTSADHDEGGRGLAILAALADTWGIQHNDGAKSVWFHLNITNHASP